MNCPTSSLFDIKQHYKLNFDVLICVFLDFLCFKMSYICKKYN